MKTTIYQAKDLSETTVISHIKNTLHTGGLVVFPTETVYGIGANATDEKAVKSIFLAKGRPSDNPLIVHVSKESDIFLYIKDFPIIANQLMDHFWPGALTLIFNKNESIPYSVTGGLDTVAIRMPSHPIAKEVIRIANLPICAPSANLSGKPSSTLFEHVRDDFFGKVDIIIDGGKTNIGLESTVLDITQPIPVLLRPGAVTKEMIEKVLDMVIIDGSEIEITDTPKSPGMKYKHYAPKGEVILVDGKTEALKNYFKHINENEQSSRIGYIGVYEVIEQLNSPYKAYLGHLSDLNEIASNVFVALRQMDALNVDKIYIHAIPKLALGKAIMNRLSKAANYHIIKL